jgi:hypothetical protein
MNDNKPEIMKKAIEELLNMPTVYRFDVFQGDKDQTGKVSKTKSIGMAYLKQGDRRYSLRLSTFVKDQFFLLPHNSDPALYCVLTSIQNPLKNTDRKHIWNVVGNGKANTQEGLIELQFDLFEKPIYVNIFPERSATGTKIPAPVIFDEAA